MNYIIDNNIFIKIKYMISNKILDKIILLIKWYI